MNKVDQNLTIKDSLMISKAVGIDISKDKFDVYLVVDNDISKGVFDNDKKGFKKFDSWIQKNQGHKAHVCLEATGRYGDGLAEHMFSQKYPVSVVNPIRIKAYARSRMERNKTDMIDSKVIAHFCQTQNPPLWEPASEQVKELQALTRHLQSLKEELTRVKNRLQSGITSKTILKRLKKQEKWLKAEIKDIEKLILAHVKKHPDLNKNFELLKSIKGIGDVTAAQFLAEVPDISKFDSVEQLIAFAGLSPKIIQSGSSTMKNGGINKLGKKRLRTSFFMPALSAMRHNPIIKRFAERLRAKGKHKMVIVVACMRKLMHLAFGVLKTGRVFDPNYLANVQNTA